MLKESDEVDTPRGDTNHFSLSSAENFFWRGNFRARRDSMRRLKGEQSYAVHRKQNRRAERRKISAHARARSATGARTRPAHTRVAATLLRAGHVRRGAREGT